MVDVCDISGSGAVDGDAVWRGTREWEADPRPATKEHRHETSSSVDAANYLARDDRLMRHVLLQYRADASQNLKRK